MQALELGLAGAHGDVEAAIVDDRGEILGTRLDLAGEDGAGGGIGEADREAIAAVAVEDSQRGLLAAAGASTEQEAEDPGVAQALDHGGGDRG